MRTRSWLGLWMWLAAVALAGGATVQIQTVHFTGRTNNRPILITPVTAPAIGAGGTNFVVGPSLTVQPTNGVVTTNLVTGYYRLAFDGLAGSLTIWVPDEAGTYNAAALVTNSVAVANTNAPWVSQLVAGSGVSLSPTNGRGSVTVSAVGGEATATNVVWTNNMLSSRVLWVDGARGNDATAQRQDPTRPWATVLAAATNAVEGDVIVVMSGSYIAGSLGTNLVNWVLEGGAELVSDYPVFTLTNAAATISGAGAVTNTADGSVLVLENSTVLLDGVTLGGRIELIGTNNVLTLRDCTVLGPRDWLLGGAGNDVRFFGAESAYICTNTAPSIVGTLGVRR